jgi:uncharacterized membrane protein YeaQ/YmgE (transglycosylase-associated protein family)
MGILSWIVLGLLVGVLAKLIMPGKQGFGFIMTIILGIVGAFVGGFIGTLLGIGDIKGFDLVSILLATGGAILVLIIYGMLKKK